MNVYLDVILIGWVLYSLGFTLYLALVLLDNQKRMMYYWMVLVLLFLAELFLF